MHIQLTRVNWTYDSQGAAEAFQHNLLTVRQEHKGDRTCRK
jgi:hypothetical protein